MPGAVPRQSLTPGQRAVGKTRPVTSREIDRFARIAFALTARAGVAKRHHTCLLRRLRGAVIHEENIATRHADVFEERTLRRTANCGDADVEPQPILIAP